MQSYDGSIYNPLAALSLLFRLYKLLYNIFNDANLVQMFFLNKFFPTVHHKWTAAPVFEAGLSFKIINVHLVR
jgi:hypothetical protein